MPLLLDASRQDTFFMYWGHPITISLALNPEKNIVELRIQIVYLNFGNAGKIIFHPKNHKNRKNNDGDRPKKEDNAKSKTTTTVRSSHDHDGGYDEPLARRAAVYDIGLRVFDDDALAGVAIVVIVVVVVVATTKSTAASIPRGRRSEEEWGGRRRRHRRRGGASPQASPRGIT